MWLHHLVFEEKQPIDLLVIGQSQVWTAFLASEAERLFAEAGHPNTVVRVMAHNWVGADVGFTVLTDLLARREVRNVLIDESSNFSHERMHRLLYEIWPQSYLPRTPDQISIWAQHAARMYETPRKLLELVRAGSRRIESDRRIEDFFPEIEPVHGNLEFTSQEAQGPFSDELPRVTQTAAPKDELSFDRDCDDYYIEKIHSLVKSKNINVLWMPIFWKSRDPKGHLCKLSEKWLKSDQFIQMSSARFLERYSDEELKRLYYNPGHPNRNGALLLTRSIFPQLNEKMVFSQSSSP